MINCASWLHLPEGCALDELIDKIAGTLSQCKVLIVLVTPALYQSVQCLRQIAAAFESNIPVLPLLFEYNKEVRRAYVVDNCRS